jgi:hypothetical protein
LKSFTEKRQARGARPTHASTCPHISLELSFAGMKFAAAGELTERPFSTLDPAARCRSRGKGGVFAPIGGCRMYTPDIAGLIQRDPHHPPLSPRSQRHTIGHPGSHTFACGKSVERNRQTGLKRTRDSYSAPLRIDHQGMCGFGKLSCGVQAGDANWNLGAYAGAAPTGVGCVVVGFHMRAF